MGRNVRVVFIAREAFWSFRMLKGFPHRGQFGGGGPEATIGVRKSEA
jgi:hypothetical protein